MIVETEASAERARRLGLKPLYKRKNFARYAWGDIEQNEKPVPAFVKDMVACITEVATADRGAVGDVTALMLEYTMHVRQHVTLSPWGCSHMLLRLYHGDRVKRHPGSWSR